jgi:serine/threonine protein kinase
LHRSAVESAVTHREFRNLSASHIQRTMSLSKGMLLGPYEALAPIGAGGTGEVYKARDPRLGREVAVKVLSSEMTRRPDLRERFDRGARAVSCLNHPHICTLHDIGRHDGIDFVVMEYLEGETLAQRLEHGPLSLAETLRYAIDIASALDAAFHMGVTYRDLTPANVMLTKSGAKLLDSRAKLLDFGLARINVRGSTHRAETAALTTEGTIVGTVQYMAAEQLEGKDADVRTIFLLLAWCSTKCSQAGRRLRAKARPV